MTIRLFNPRSPGTRFGSSLTNYDLTRTEPEKSLTVKKKRSGGRNNLGRITARGRGGGHKRKIRIIDFTRKTSDITAQVVSIEYDPNRNARIALLSYKNGVKKYIICPRFLTVGMQVSSGMYSPLEVGNSLTLASIPLGTFIHNVELVLGKGAQMARAAGALCQVVSKEGNYVSLKLPSKEVRLVHKKCSATLGQVGNIDVKNIVLGKAGRNRWLGKTPSVRGVAMNPNDHPHGGGEGRSPIGRKKPVTP